MPAPLVSGWATEHFPCVLGIPILHICFLPSSVKWKRPIPTFPHSFAFWVPDFESEATDSMKTGFHRMCYCGGWQHFFSEGCVQWQGSASVPRLHLCLLQHHSVGFYLKAAKLRSLYLATKSSCCGDPVAWSPAVSRLLHCLWPCLMTLDESDKRPDSLFLKWWCLIVLVFVNWRWGVVLSTPSTPSQPAHSRGQHNPAPSILW